MAIRIVDRRAHLGRVAAQLADSTPLFQGTHVRPPGRTGVVSSQLSPAVGSLIGGFTAGANRTGQLITTLGDTVSLMTGTFTPSSGTFVYPIGVPTFPFSFQQAVPQPPSNWNSSTAGFYFVRQGGSASHNGFPGQPRGSLPTSVPAGSVVVLADDVPLNLTNVNYTMTGSVGAPVFLVSARKVGLGTQSATMRYTGSCNISGQWGIVDDIDFFCDTVTQDSWGTQTPQNFVFRNCTIRGNGQSRAANSSNYIGGSSTSNRAQNVMFWNCVVRDLGNWQFVGPDIDCHGLTFGQWVQDVWVIDCQFFHNQGDGIQFTGGSPNGNSPTDVRRVYVGRSTFYENLQTGFWHKLGHTLVFTQNDVYNHLSGGGSAPVACGGQYDFSSVWYLFNRIHNNGSGIRFASNNNGTGDGRIFCIGNVIYDCVGAAASDAATSAFSDGCGINFWQGSQIVCAFNTINGFNAHGIACTPGAGNGAKIENNIIQGRASNSLFDLMWESFTTQPGVRNNAFPANPRFRMAGTNTTTLATFQSGSSANRTNNQAAAVSFLNAAGKDFRVNVGDPTIGGGLITTDVFATYLADVGVDIRKDLLGVVRPQFSTYDIGAYESTDTPPALSVGNSGMVVQRVGEGQDLASTSAFNTVNGMMLVAVGRQKISEFATATVTDNAGNSYALNGTSHDYAPQWPTSGTGVYIKTGAVGRTGCIVTDSKPSNGDEITVLAINIIGATQVEASSYNYVQSGANVGIAITVTKPSVLVCVWSGNGPDGESNPQFSAGWTRRQFTTLTNGNHVQMALATREVPAGTYNVTVTPALTQGAQIYLFGLN